MDWTAPLKSQQADFATRLAAGVDRLLRCQLQGCFSEAIAISAERFEQAASVARKGAMFATSNRHSDFAIEKVGQQHACCHLALEFLADCLGRRSPRRRLPPMVSVPCLQTFPKSTSMSLSERKIRKRLTGRFIPVI
ncbi:MAG: hypothetical protein HC925_02535 [Coleofasciculaceae cyanobacterium SM2_3_26]|nr:hypothetical protein [Coleofasciculaceae cyanobacterium SM2_3_26]